MLNIACDWCHRPLTKPGGLLFGPPTASLRGPLTCQKHHLCRECYEYILVSKGAITMTNEKRVTVTRWVFFIITLLSTIGLIVASVVLFMVPHAMGVIPLIIAAGLAYFFLRLDIKTLFLDRKRDE